MAARQTQTGQSVDPNHMPVESWQLKVIEKQVDQHENLIKSIDTKLETILIAVQGRPTETQVDDKIKAAQLIIRDELKNAIEKQDLKYGPIVATNKKLLWAVVGSGLGIIASLVTLFIGIFTK